MKGLYGINKEKTSWPIHELDFSLNRDSNQKFLEDKIFMRAGHYIIALDGVILNKKEVLSPLLSWQDFFLNNLSHLEQALGQLKGSFHGVIYNSLNKEIILFNDPTGSKNFVYYYDGKDFIFHFDDVSLIHLLKQEKKNIKIDKQAIYGFLAYGFLPSTCSWIQHAQRLEPGSVLRFKDGHIILKRYKVFESQPQSLGSTQPYIEEFQHWFERAVHLQYQKDKEHGYQHYATLSGGLDSRSTMLQAYDLGFTQQTAFTCSQTNYADHTIAKKIAEDYGFTHLFYPLDAPNHLIHLPHTLHQIGGSALYTGPAHVMQGIEENWDKDFGLIHSGHIGDGVMGAFLSSTQRTRPDISYGRISPHRLPLDPELDNMMTSKYVTEETFKLYERGLNGAAGGVWGLEHISYNISPFVDTDVLDFLLALPYPLKFRRKIYVDWLLRYHQDWTHYPLESLHAKPNAYWKFKYQKSYLRLRFGWRKLLSRNFRLLHQMAPEQYWFEHSPQLQNYYQQPFEEAMAVGTAFKLDYINIIKDLNVSPHFIDRAKSLHVAYMILLIYK